MHFTKESMNESLVKMHLDYRHETDIWGHECWECESAFETSEKVRNGIPYWILRRFYSLFNKLK
jgi:hypothetical protein